MPFLSPNQQCHSTEGKFLQPAYWSLMFLAVMGILQNKQWHGLCRVPTSIPRKPTGTAGVTHVARRAGKNLGF